MKVFKFGGASVKDADSIKNLSSIVKDQLVLNEDLLIVVSAMGKMTNALEELLNLFLTNSAEMAPHFEQIKSFHLEIMASLFPPEHNIYAEVNNHFVEIEWLIEEEPLREADYYYGQLVSMGELLSTSIVAAYLGQVLENVEWLDARGLIRTDNQYRNAIVDWDTTQQQIKAQVKSSKKEGSKIFVTQGFIGGTSENFTTTLGREGSDFSAAIFASVLNATDLVIWKDVEGMYNADPNVFSNTVKLNNLSFHETIELAYYGASVIHPKTIKPLQNKGIPLYVKSFLNPDRKGTLINQDASNDHLIPSYILKPNQTLVSISAKDFSFIVETHLTEIFKKFVNHGISIHLMQNSAISFSICVDSLPALHALIKELGSNYKVSYNERVSLLTVRHYTEDVLADLLTNKEVLLEQKSRTTARFVIKDLD